jgi:hypothetical protein
MLIKQKNIVKLKTWEFGFWGGGSIYGGGDIGHKFWPIPSTVEYSGGIYGQYNINSAFSLKSNVYNSWISMHNMYAPLILSGGVIPKTLNPDYKEINAVNNTFNLNFITKMWIADIEGLWHLRPLDLKNRQKSKVVPSIGLAVGVVHYDPYRVIYRKWKRKEMSWSEHKANVYANDLYSLRDLGSEGQNFLPGQKPYSSLAFSASGSFSLAYVRKRWAFKAEIKGTYTSTDYLDDFGPGTWYGGDILKLQASSQIQDISARDLNKIIYHEGGINQAPDILSTAARSTDGLNDWYYQLHMGLSYILLSK